MIDSSWLSSLSPLFAFGLIALEFLLGVFMLVGIYRRLTSRVMFLTMFVMTVLTGYIYVSGQILDCGCFGDVIRLTPQETFVKNLLLLPLSFFVMRGARKLEHLYSRRERWIPAILALGGIGIFQYWNYRDLPYYDLLPYRVGYDIREQVYKADSAFMAHIERETRYIYEHDGQEREFSLHELPDSSWSYVKMTQPQDLDLLKSDYNFHIFTPYGEEITDEILNNDRGVLLLCSPSWKQADQSSIDVINEMHRYAEQSGYALYGVSASLADEEGEWRYQTGATYPSLFLDVATIRVLTRSNPGLIFMRSGKILDKVPPTRMPDIEHIPEFVEDRMLGQVQSSPDRWHTLPLVLLVGFVLYGIIRRSLRHILALRYLEVKRRRK